MKKVFVIPTICMFVAVFLFQACKEKLKHLQGLTPWLPQSGCPIALDKGTVAVATGKTDEICVIGNEESQSLVCTYKVHIEGIGGEWMSLGKLNQARSGHEVVAVETREGRQIQRQMLVFGGFYHSAATGKREAAMSIEQMGATPDWKTVGQLPMPQASVLRGLAAAVYYPENKPENAVVIVIAGGEVWQFSPIRLQWEAGSLPNAPVSLFQSRAIVVGDVLYYLGATSSEEGKVKMYRLNLKTRLWDAGVTVGCYGEQFSALSGVSRVGDRLVITGVSSNDFFMYYNLIKGEFEAGKKVYGGDMPTNTNGMLVVGLPSGNYPQKFALLGGDENALAHYVYCMGMD